MLHWHGLCRVWAMCNDRLLHHLQPTQYDPMHCQRLERYAPQRRHFQGFVVGVQQAFIWRQHARLPLHAVPAVGHGAYSCWDRVGAHVHWGLHCCSLGDQAHPGATFLRARSLSASHARTSRSWPRTSLLLPCEGPAAWVARVGVGGGGGARGLVGRVGSELTGFSLEFTGFFPREKSCKARGKSCCSAIRHNHRPGYKVHGCVRDRLQLEKCSCSVQLQTCNPQ